ncbi:MAG: CRISPR-associated endonuclease Cas1, partial [Phormidesmis sp.]
VRTHKETFELTSRSKRPPKDPINALLSFVYTGYQLKAKNLLRIRF